MDSSALLSLLEQFDGDVDDLEESLEPLLKSGFSTTSSKLPLLDKAKLYILVTYAIESILFSYLRLNGINAREQPVFKELTRVKQYFDKVKVLDIPDTSRPSKLDKGAAARFIKAGLANNDVCHYGSGKSENGGVIPPDTQFQDVQNTVIENLFTNQVNVSSSDREDKILNMTVSPRKRKTTDSEPHSSISDINSDAGTPEAKRKVAKRQGQNSKGKKKVS